MPENEEKKWPILTTRSPVFLNVVFGRIAESAENMVATGHILAVHFQVFFIPSM